jgi:hypothetical protein
LRNGKLLRLGRRGIRNIKSDAIQDRFEGRRLVEAFEEALGAKQSVGIVDFFDNTARETSGLG